MSPRPQRRGWAGGSGLGEAGLGVLLAPGLAGHGPLTPMPPASAAMQCDGGQEYSACGPPCPQTCQNFGLELPEHCDTMSCLEGCFCPEGKVLHGEHGAAGGLPQMRLAHAVLADTSLPPCWQRAAALTLPSVRVSGRASPSRPAPGCSRAAGTGEWGESGVSPSLALPRHQVQGGRAGATHQD